MIVNGYDLDLEKIDNKDYDNADELFFKLGFIKYRFSGGICYLSHSIYSKLEKSVIFNFWNYDFDISNECLHIDKDKLYRLMQAIVRKMENLKWIDKEQV